MTAPGLEHFLARLWQSWQFRGAQPEAQPLFDREGWSLSLCFRARLSAWLIFLLFAGGFVAVFSQQAVQPQRKFVLLAVGYSVFMAMAGYYLIFVYWHRVLLDEEGISLFRFLVPTRHLRWDEIVEFDYKDGDELLKLKSRSGKKISLYLSLHGLSAIRRCLAAFSSSSEITPSWSTADSCLMRNVPSWRCDDLDLEDNPFDPLGTWKTGTIETQISDTPFSDDDSEH